MSTCTSLHGVLDKDNWNMADIKIFLEYDSSSVNEVNSSGDTPLFRILENDKCSVNVVQLLLNYGANVNCNNRHGSSPLVIALLHRRNGNFINLLLEKDADINVSSDSLICFALSQKSSIDVIRLLLDAGGLPPPCQYHGPALHCASYHLRYRYTKEDVLQLLIERKADVNAVVPPGRSVLCYALGLGIQASSIKVLLAAGGVINCIKHNNPMLCATINTDTELKADIVQLLLQQGACVNNDVLQCALYKCKIETEAIGLLLDCYQGVDINVVKDKFNNTLLHLAVNNPHVKESVVKLLVKRGVGIDRVNYQGETALHEAAKCRRSSVVKTLLKSGSRVNLENAYGETPLHLAMMQLFQDADTLKILLAAGARFGITGYSLLNSIIDKRNACLEMNEDDYLIPYISLDYCKMLVKFYFIENPHFDFQYLIQGHREYEELSRFGVDCVRELQKLDSKIVGQVRTLREFLSECSPFQVDAANFEVEAESVLFNWLLRIIGETVFPLFFDIILSKVGRSLMKIKLEKLQVYTYLSDESRMGEKVVLHYDTVYKIAHLLTDEDLLRFISAFNKTNDHSCPRKVSK